MKTSAVASLVLLLLSTPQLSLGRSVPIRGLNHRLTDLNPPEHEYDGTRCDTAKCRELFGVVAKRADVPIIPEGELGAAAGEAAAGESAGEAAAGAGAIHPGTAGAAGGGEAAAGAQTGGPLGPLGNPLSGPGKRPLDPDSGASDTGSPDPKNPKTGAGPGSDDDGAAAPDAPDDVFTGDDLATNAADPTGVLDIRDRGYQIMSTLAGDEVTFQVNDPTGQILVDAIRVNKAEKSLFLDDLNNDFDTTVNRVRAWEVQMSLFVHETKFSPSDLTAINMDSVSEENTLPVLEEIILRRGEIFKLPPDENPAADALLTPDQLADRKAVEKEDFDKILATKLGRSSQALLRDTPVGKQIVIIEVGIGRGADDPSLDFTLR